MKVDIELMNFIIGGTHLQKEQSFKWAVNSVGMMFHKEQLDWVGGIVFCGGMGTKLLTNDERNLLMISQIGPRLITSLRCMSLFTMRWWILG